MARVIDLAGYALTHAQYAVLWHVADTVVIDRQSLAEWTASNLPNNVPAKITAADCLVAIDSLVERHLLEVWTEAALEADRARWRDEPLPVSFGALLARSEGDLDLTAAGYELMRAISRRDVLTEPPLTGYDDREPGVLRVLADTEMRCTDTAVRYAAMTAQSPWQWPPNAARIGPTEHVGPWWYDRHRKVATGYQAIIRRV